MARDKLSESDLKMIKERKQDEQENRRRILIKKADWKHELRGKHIERREATEVEMLQRAKEEFDQKLRRVELDEKLAAELALRKSLEHQESSQRRKLRHSISILPDNTARELETKAKEGKDKYDCIPHHIPDLWPFSVDEDPVEVHNKKLTYRKELLDQQIYNRRKVREKEEEKHRERKILEEVGERLREEDLQAEKREKEKAALLQAERDAFLKARQLWKGKRRDVLRKEHDEIAQIIVKKETQQRKETERKTDTQAMKDALVERLGKKIQDVELKKAERERICRELYLAEKENELANEVMKLALEKKRTAKELMQDMARQRKVQAEKKAKEDAVDEAFARYLAEERRKMEETQKKEEEAHHQKMMQYGNDLREVIMKNRAKLEKEIMERRKGQEPERKGRLSDSKFCGSNVKSHSEPILKGSESHRSNNPTEGNP